MTSIKSTAELDNEIWELFKSRCLMNPAHPGEVIHEIEFRSQRPKDWTDPSNRVLLCNKCHDLAHGKHKMGWKLLLIELRAGWVEKYG